MCASDSVVRTETPVEPGVGVAETQQDPATESASVQRVAGSADDRPQPQQNSLPASQSCTPSPARLLQTQRHVQPVGAWIRDQVSVSVSI